VAQLNPTNPNAAKLEAAELRAEANSLLQRAEQLDPTPEPKKPAKKPARKKPTRRKPQAKKPAKKRLFSRGKKSKRGKK